MSLILIVEDDKTSRFLLEKILHAHGYDAVTASSGVEALRILNDGRRPDLIISDVMMPNINGLEFVRRVRENPDISDIPIMLCTAVHDKDAVIQAAKLDIQHYVVKPLDADKLVAEIERILPKNDKRQPDPDLSTNILAGND